MKKLILFILGLLVWVFIIAMALRFVAPIALFVTVITTLGLLALVDIFM